MKKRVHAYYIGRVQGVGFRFAAVDIALKLGVSGWVKNLPDGRVEVTAESEEDSLKEFLKMIFSNFSGYIQDVETEWPAATGEFKDFKIGF